MVGRQSPQLTVLGQERLYFVSSWISFSRTVSGCNDCCGSIGESSYRFELGRPETGDFFRRFACELGQRGRHETVSAPGGLDHFHGKTGDAHQTFAIPVNLGSLTAKSDYHQSTSRNSKRPDRSTRIIDTGKVGKLFVTQFQNVDLFGQSPDPIEISFLIRNQRFTNGWIERDRYPYLHKTVDDRAIGRRGRFFRQHDSTAVIQR